MVEQFFDQISTLLSGIFSLAQGGFDRVNQVLGLVIALVAAILLKSWKRLFPLAAFSAAVHILIQTVRPVLDGGQVTLPPLVTLEFWLSVFALFLGYAIVIAVFYFVKRYILRQN